MTSWEYTSDTADAWEIHHLCNHFARAGWEPVLMSSVPRESVVLPVTIGDENGPSRAGHPVAPLHVLFRREVQPE